MLQVVLGDGKTPWLLGLTLIPHWDNPKSCCGSDLLILALHHWLYNSYALGFYFFFFSKHFSTLCYSFLNEYRRTFNVNPLYHPIFLMPADSTNLNQWQPFPVPTFWLLAKKKNINWNMTLIWFHAQYSVTTVIAMSRLVISKPVALFKGLTRGAGSSLLMPPEMMSRIPILDPIH